MCGIALGWLDQKGIRLDQEVSTEGVANPFCGGRKNFGIAALSGCAAMRCQVVLLVAYEGRGTKKAENPRPRP